MQLLMTMNGITGFNTTFVTVLYHEFTEAELTALFQYNFCYCSIYHPFLMQVANNCFNTTFVTVLFFSPETTPEEVSFNTTFVTVLYWHNG